MSVDTEFFHIVERLGPMGDIDLRSYESHPATGGPDAGGGTSRPAARATTRDTETRPWWTWDASRGGWKRST